MTQETKITLVGCGIASVAVVAMSARIAYIEGWKKKELEKLTTENNGEVGEFFHFSFNGDAQLRSEAQEVLDMLFKQLMESKTKKSFRKWVEVVKKFREEITGCCAPCVVIAKYKALYTPDEEPKVVYTVPLV